MKSLIVRSLDHSHDVSDAAEESNESPDADPQHQLETVCLVIGGALAKDGHTIVIGTASDSTANRFVLEGANSVKANTRYCDSAGRWPTSSHRRPI